MKESDDFQHHFSTDQDDDSIHSQHLTTNQPVHSNKAHAEEIKKKSKKLSKRLKRFLGIKSKKNRTPVAEYVDSPDVSNDDDDADYEKDDMPYQSEDDYPAEKESIDFQELSNLPSALTRRLSIQSVAASLAMIQFNDVQNVDSPQKALQDKIKDLLGVTENDDFEVRESMDIFSSGLEAETVHGHGRFYNETLQAKDSTALDSINNLMDDVERFLSEMGMGTSKPPPKKEVRNTWEASESDGYNSVHEYIDMVGNRNSFESAQSFDPFPENKSLPGSGRRSTTPTPKVEIDPNVSSNPANLQRSQTTSATTSTWLSKWASKQEEKVERAVSPEAQRLQDRLKEKIQARIAGSATSQSAFSPSTVNSNESVIPMDDAFGNPDSNPSSTKNDVPEVIDATLEAEEKQSFDTIRGQPNNSIESGRISTETYRDKSEANDPVLDHLSKIESLVDSSVKTTVKAKGAKLNPIITQHPVPTKHDHDDLIFSAKDKMDPAYLSSMFGTSGATAQMVQSRRVSAMEGGVKRLSQAGMISANAYQDKSQIPIVSEIESGEIVFSAKDIKASQIPELFGTDSPISPVYAGAYNQRKKSVDLMQNGVRRLSNASLISKASRLSIKTDKSPKADDVLFSAKDIKMNQIPELFGTASPISPVYTGAYCQRKKSLDLMQNGIRRLSSGSVLSDSGHSGSSGRSSGRHSRAKKKSIKPDTQNADVIFSPKDIRVNQIPELFGQSSPISPVYTGQYNKRATDGSRRVSAFGFFPESTAGSRRVSQMPNRMSVGFSDNGHDEDEMEEKGKPPLCPIVTQNKVVFNAEEDSCFSARDTLKPNLIPDLFGQASPISPSYIGGYDKRKSSMSLSDKSSDFNNSSNPTINNLGLAAKKLIPEEEEDGVFSPRDSLKFNQIPELFGQSSPISPSYVGAYEAHRNASSALRIKNAAIKEISKIANQDSDEEEIVILNEVVKIHHTQPPVDGIHTLKPKGATDPNEATIFSKATEKIKPGVVADLFGLESPISPVGDGARKQPANLDAESRRLSGISFNSQASKIHSEHGSISDNASLVSRKGSLPIEKNSVLVADPVEVTTENIVEPELQSISEELKPVYESLKQLDTSKFDSADIQVIYKALDTLSRSQTVSLGDVISPNGTQNPVESELDDSYSDMSKRLSHPEVQELIRRSQSEIFNPARKGEEYDPFPDSRDTFEDPYRSGPPSGSTTPTPRKSLFRTITKKLSENFLKK